MVRGLVAWDTYHDDMAEMLAPMLSSAGYREYRTAFDDPRVMRPHAEKVGGRLDPAERRRPTGAACLRDLIHPPNRPVPQCD